MDRQQMNGIIKTLEGDETQTENWTTINQFDYVLWSLRVARMTWRYPGWTFGTVVDMDGQSG